jgi:hypothetical protein
MGVCDGKPVRCTAFRSIGEAAQLRLGDFNVQELANTAWAFATASQ